MGLPLCASLPVSEVSWSSACIETTPTSRQRYDLKKVKINLLHEFMQEFERRFQEIIFFPIFLSCQNGSNGKCTSLICKVEGSWRVRFYLFLTPSLRICCELNRILNDNISQTVWMCHYGFNGFIVKIRAFNARTYVHFFIYV